MGDGVFGCVTQTGEQGGNIGKSASLLAGWSPYMGAVTINRFCASGLCAVNFASYQAQNSDMLAVGGGVEMMSRVPMFGDQPAYLGDKALASPAQTHGSDAAVCVLRAGVVLHQADLLTVLALPSRQPMPSGLTR